MKIGINHHFYQLIVKQFGLNEHKKDYILIFYFFPEKTIIIIIVIFRLFNKVLFVNIT